MEYDLFKNISKKLILFLYLLPLLGIAQQKTYVPDDIFELYIESIDTTYNSCSFGSPASIGDGIMNDSVYTDYLNVIGAIDVTNMGVYDLTGIEAIDSLIYLYCNNNNLIKIPFSDYQKKNIHLVHCADNKIDSLDFSGNVKLGDLRCNDNELVYLNLDSCINLFDGLDCSDNRLTTLDLSDCKSLMWVNCEDNLLTNLGFGSIHNYLYEIYCTNNQITSLNLTGVMSSIHMIYCANNQLTSITTSPGISPQVLYCSNNNLTDGSVDLSNTGILDCSYNQFNNLDLSFPNSSPFGRGAVNCSNNDLYSLNIKNINDTSFVNHNDYVFDATNNPNLHCITVTTLAFADSAWTYQNGNIDSCVTFSLDCSVEIEGCMDSLDVSYNPAATIEDCSCSYMVSAINNHFNSNKVLIDIVDVLGRKTQPTPNTPLFYRYSDGTVEKKLIIE